MRLLTVNRNISRTLLFFLLCGLSLLYLGVEPALAEKDSLINPLRKYVKFREIRSFRDKVETLIDRKKEEGLAKEVAVYFRCLSDGIWFGIKERDKFAPASLMKVPVMIAYFKEAENDPKILEKKIQYEDLTDTADLFVKPKSMLKPGQYYTADKLIKAMIVDSDNNAFLILTKNIDTATLAGTYINMGILQTFREEGDFISLKATVGMFRVLYNASYLNEKMSEKALRYLSAVSYKGGIPAGLPKDVVVAHKFGERIRPEENTKQIHDVGIIYYGDSPYLLGIMTRGDDFRKLENVIRDISALVYHEVDNQYKTRDGKIYPINADEPD